MRLHALLFISAVIIWDLTASVSTSSESTAVQLRQLGACECDEYSCGCCEHIEIDEIDLNDTVCLEIEYIPETISLSLIFSIDGKVYFNETVSALDPNICFGLPVPVLDYLVKVCIEFSNVNITDSDISGCVAVGFKVLGEELGKFDLGCFNIPIELDKPKVITRSAQA